MPRQKLSLRLLLPLVLLFAQLGAIAHAYTHSRTTADLAGSVDQAQFCAQCQSGATLLSAAGCPSHDFDIRATGSNVVAHAKAVSLIEAGPRHSFQSRAPPHLS